jgi:hypothetical protein
LASDHATGRRRAALLGDALDVATQLDLFGKQRGARRAVFLAQFG